MSNLKVAGGEATESRERIVGETAEVGVRKKGIGFQEEAGRQDASMGAFLQRFKESMKEAGIEVAEWPARLRPLFSGKDLTAYFKDVPEEAKKDYEHLKEAILDAMGLSVKECRADYFSIIRSHVNHAKRQLGMLSFMSTE